MNKRFLIVVVVTLLVGVGVLVHVSQLDKAEKLSFTQSDLAQIAAKLGVTNAAQTVLQPIDLSKRVRLAIGGLGLADNDQNHQLGDLVTAELTGAQGFDLVERQSLDAILREMNLSWSGFVRAKDAVRVGKLLKADWFLLGTQAKINGTNSIVVRVVDAHTGIMRDAGVFQSERSPVQLSKDLGVFLRQSRQNAALAKTRVYLAIGAFEDLSLNNRLADFPTQLRGYLTAAYQGTVTLLEREYVDTLLREVRLDLAGLTEESGANAPAPMQSAFWLVTGQYQSYETTNMQVELVLDVKQIFGRGIVFAPLSPDALRDQPGEPIFRKAKKVIDEALRKNVTTLSPTRYTEVRAQMDIGEEILQVKYFGHFDFVAVLGSWDLDSQAAARKKRNIEEAMRAFQTVLLLEPTNRVAKMYLAGCLRMPVIYQVDEARNYYREIIEESKQDKWSDLAQKALLDTFRRSSWNFNDPVEEASWLESAAKNTANPIAVEFYRKQAQEVRTKIALKNDESKSQELAQARILFNITNSWTEKVTTGVAMSSLAEIHDFVKAFGDDQDIAAQRVAELYPILKAQTPHFAPYLLAQFVTVQEYVNAPLVVEFRRMVEQYATHPDQVFESEKFWGHIWPAFEWSYNHKLYGTAARLLEGKIHAKAISPRIGDTEFEDDADNMGLAYAYLKGEQWEKALKIFESYSNEPVQIIFPGPWEESSSMVFPAKQAAYCRQQLGLSAAPNPLEFSMGKPLLCLCTPSTFVADDKCLWVGINGQLMQLDFDLKTNFVIQLPMDSFVQITALSLTSSNMWIATDGEGLIEFDRRSQKCRRYSVEAGLMMDTISALYLDGDTLWIGYGHRTYGFDRDTSSTLIGGGLGQLNLKTYRFTASTMSIAEGTDSLKNFADRSLQRPPDRPTRGPVIAIAGAATHDVWLVAEEGPTRLRQYRPKENAWTNGTFVYLNSSCLASDAERLFVGQYNAPQLGVCVLNFKDGQWRSLNGMDGIPPGNVTTLTVDDKKLWVGGKGYIALVDPVQDKVLKFAYVKSPVVNRIQIAGGYVWAQFDWHLYRVPLADLAK